MVSNGHTLQPALKDPSLFLEHGLIDGKWTAAKSGKTFQVRYPGSGAHVATLPEMDGSDCSLAIGAASSAFSTFKRTTGRQRARLLRTLNDMVLSNAADLAELIVRETGKTRAEAEGEIVYAASFLEWFSGEAERTYGDVIPAANPNNRILTIKQPIGVVACLCPWNLPLAMATRKVGAALAAGCTMVLKPAGETPLSSLAFAELAARAGVPPGVLNVVTGLETTAELGLILSTDPRVKKISFTGSTRVGKLLARQGADTLKKLSLELGGNGPVIIFDDADLDKAVAGTIASKFRNSGQTCTAANRIFVQSGIHDEYVRRLVGKVKTMKHGPSEDASNTIGPLISTRAVAKAASHVTDALSKGATVAFGPSAAPPVPSEGGFFYPPTVLTGLTDDMQISVEETFAPVAAIRKFETIEEVLKAANDSTVGLGSYVYTTDVRKIFKVCEELESGMVGANTGFTSASEMPFGGWKESGYGKEGSKYGLDDYMVVKAITIDVM